MNQPIIPYGRQWIDKSDVRAVVATLRSNWLTQGPTIEKFEQSVVEKVRAKFGVACFNGTAALHLACLAAGIKPGDEVIVPTLSFAASANCVLYCNAKPVLCDINPETLTIAVEDVERKITPKTKAIIAVDFAGHPADWDRLLKICRKSGLILIDDAAHALGTLYKERPIGSIADLTTFSFHPVKTITTAEGGMIVTSNKQYAEKLKLYRNHGIRKPAQQNSKHKNQPAGWFQEMVALGYNFRITDIQAALGLSQLKKLNQFLKRRQYIANEYLRAFSNIDEIILPPNHGYVKHAWHIFTLQFKTKRRDDAYNQLRECGVGTQVHYMPIHLQPYYGEHFGYRRGDFPSAEKYFSRCLTIPLFPAMTDRMIKKVVRSVLKVIGS